MRNIIVGSLLVLLLQGASPVAAANHPDSFEGFLNLSQPYITNVAAYNPLFFLIGTDLADSKFQISFKYKFFEASGDRSLPFKDTSYKPELFYHTANLAGDEGSWADGLILDSDLSLASQGGSYQFDLTYPLRTHLMRADYQMRTEALRLGLSFVR